ncbi:MAG: hypothetical protein AAF198_02110 [Pseudomonadota bacterium]
MKRLSLAALSLLAFTGLAEAHTLNSSSGGSNSGVGGFTDSAFPDLAILPAYGGGASGKPKTGFCGPIKNGLPQIAFYVKNIGDKASPSTPYGAAPPGTIALSTSGVPMVPALNPGQQHLITRNVIENWMNDGKPPSVSFQIRVNQQKKFSEKSFQNNTRKGKCLGGKTLYKG